MAGEAYPEGIGGRLVSVGDIGGDGGEFDGLAAVEAWLATGHGEQRVDKLSCLSALMDAGGHDVLDTGRKTWADDPAAYAASLSAREPISLVVRSLCDGVRRGGKASHRRGFFVPSHIVAVDDAIIVSQRDALATGLFAGFLGSLKVTGGLI